MKATTNRHYWKMLCLAALCLLTASMCSEDDDPLVNPETPETPENPVDPIPAKGELTCQFVLDGDTAEATPTLQVQAGDTLSLTLSQQSLYTDTDGQVYTRTPQATIGLHATADTVFARDLEELTRLLGEPQLTTAKQGNNPTRHTTEQRFAIGGQQVAISLVHEVYTCTNAHSQQVEMPYIKLSPATMGSTGALTLTRASLTDSTLFEVSATFLVELQQMNVSSSTATTAAAKQTLELQLKYIGVVEHTTELSGSIAYTLSDEAGEAASPFATDGADSLSIKVAQESRFSAGDSTVYASSPQAGISFRVKNDTAWAQSLEQLKTLVESPKPSCSKEGENPVCNRCQTSFATSSQAFVFDTRYEVYTTENCLEMPHISIGEPRCIGIEVAELPTRASVADTVYYEVKAIFEVELTGMHTRDAIAEVLKFEANYTGAVKRTTELDGNLSYTLKDEQGEAKSPFKLNGKEDFLLNISQKSSYAKESSILYSSEPKASIRLKVKNDTAFVEKLELLKTLIETEDPTSSKEGENPVSNLYQRLFATASQEFAFETKYEVHKTKDGDEMPYLSISEPKCISIEVTEQAKNANTRAFTYDTVYYDVKAKFEIKINGVNTKDDISNTLEFEVNYIGGVINATEIVELVKTTYRKDQVFYEGHDNLLPRSQCEVYRDRHYSDGHIETDKFLGAPWFWIEGSVILSSGNNYIYIPSDTIIEYFPDFSVTYKASVFLEDKTNRYYAVLHSSTQIPSFEYVELYTRSKTNQTPTKYNETYFKEFEDTFYNPNGYNDGWYCFDYNYYLSQCLKYVKDNDSIDFRYHLISYRYYDRFFCIDDTLIGFEEYRPKLEATIDWIDYPGSETRGPGKIYQHIVKGKYLEHEVYMAVTDTIYTPLGSAPPVDND